VSKRITSFGDSKFYELQLLTQQRLNLDQGVHQFWLLFQLKMYVFQLRAYRARHGLGALNLWAN